MNYLPEHWGSFHACDFCRHHYYDIGSGHRCCSTGEVIEQTNIPNDCPRWEWLEYAHGYGFNGSKKSNNMIQLSLFDDCKPKKKQIVKKSTVFNDYDVFVKKFEAKKTTDDCYTPQLVYDAVLDFVKKHWNIEGREVVRPFFPGGDYERAEYPENCVVVDNPPFSILARIIRFYCVAGVDFFLFAPSLTLFTANDCDLTYIIADSQIVYDNGAVVRTGFITNLPSDIRVWVCPELKSAIDLAQKTKNKEKKMFVYPDNIVTAATLLKIAAHGVSLEIRKDECRFIKDSDGCKAVGRNLFGGGFLLSERAAAERAAAERAAAERAAADVIELSEREKKIIEGLSKL